MDRKTRDNLRNRVRRAKTKMKAIEYKGGKCEHCKSTYHPAAFDFHHVDPSQKDVDPGALMRAPEARLYAELDKCILLCANCHRIHHYDNIADKYLKDEGPLLGGDRSVFITYDGRTQTIRKWADETGIPQSTLQARLRSYDWPVEKALTSPVRGQDNKAYEYDGEMYSLNELCTIHGLPFNTVRGRLRLGWSLQKALNTPKRKTK